MTQTRAIIVLSAEIEPSWELASDAVHWGGCIFNSTMAPGAHLVKILILISIEISMFYIIKTVGLLLGVAK